MIASASFPRPACLDTIMAKPEAASCDLQNSSAYIANPMTLVCGTASRKRAAVSTPYNIGILRSRMAKSGARSLAFWMAATPLAAWQTQGFEGMTLPMKSQMAPRTAALSSTTRIHGVPGPDIRGGNYYASSPKTIRKFALFRIEAAFNFRTINFRTIDIATVFRYHPAQFLTETHWRYESGINPRGTAPSF